MIAKEKYNSETNYKNLKGMLNSLDNSRKVNQDNDYTIKLYYIFKEIQLLYFKHMLIVILSTARILTSPFEMVAGW